MTPSSRDHAALGRAGREARERAGLAQEDLAGITPTYIPDIERGVRNPSYELLLALAKALNTPLSQIMERAGR